MSCRFTMFVAGCVLYANTRLPSRVPPTLHLPTLLFLFLSRWGQVHDVKLSHAVANQSQCAFAEFTSEAEAIRALHGTKFVPFMGAYLRLEPARAERTLRFSLINPKKRCVLMDPMWLQPSVHTHQLPTPCSYQRAYMAPPIQVAFNEKLATDLAEPYGPIEMIRTRTLPHCLVVDVIFEHRDSAYKGQSVLGLLPCQSNLRVRWYGAGIMRSEDAGSNLDAVMDPRFTYVHRSLPHVNYEGPVLVPTFYKKVSDAATQRADATMYQASLGASSPTARTEYREAIVACVQLHTDDRSKVRSRS